MPDESGNESSFELDAGTLNRLSSELGLNPETLRQLPEKRLAWILNKLEIPNRPLARLQYEMDSLRDDQGEIPPDGRARALEQLDAVRREVPGITGEVAGMPVGSAVFDTNARVEGPTAGLNASNTGWTALGPGNIGGRIRALVVDPTNPNRIFAAGVGGGVWRSLDGGGTWIPTNDLMANLAVCSLVIDPTNPNILYAGTGEGFSNVDAIRGEGVFKSMDGGFTWMKITPTANSNYFYVNSLAISSDGRTILAGTTTGIFRTTDAGLHWIQVSNVPIGNLVFDPGDSANAIAGGLANGRVYFSTNGGDTWQQASRPASGGGRIHVCYAAADSLVTYASVQASPSQLWRSTDGGRTYGKKNALAGGGPANFLGAQGWYDNVAWAGDPTNSDLVIVGGINLWRSTDGGDTLKPISTWWSDQSAHADHHAIVADPGYDGVTNRQVYFCNDGGVYRTEDVTTVGNNPNEPYTNGWTRLNNGLGVTQFYYGDGHIGTNSIMGGAQDNGTLRFTPGQGTNAWKEIWGGDGGDIASDPSDPSVWYGEYVYLQIFRDTSGGNSANYPDDYICGRYWNAGWRWKPDPFTIPDAQNQKAQFIAPFELDPNNPNRLLAGGLSLWQTNDAKTPNTIVPPAGPSWNSIKGQIGNNPRLHSITAIVIVPGHSDIVVVGHANGEIYRSSNSNSPNPTWQRIDRNGINANRQCLALAVDPDDVNLIYAAFGGYQSGNIWRTDNGGVNWHDISRDLPEVPIRDVALHPQRPYWIYLATDVGVFASQDGGNSWSPTNEGPANVACRDFFWMGTRLVCVTHGRGMFVIDLPIPNAYPIPVLEFLGTENYEVQGMPFIRYNLSVRNRFQYPDSLFRPALDLPPCAPNTIGSRTWVDMYNGDTNQRISGFCDFDTAEDLDHLWFGLPRGTLPPREIYIVIRDRLSTATYTSNKVELPEIVFPPSCTVSNMLIVLGSARKLIQVIGSVTGCTVGARIDLEGPQGDTARRVENVGSVRAGGLINVEYHGEEVTAGSWRVIVVNTDGSECCHSAYAIAEVRREDDINGGWGG